MNIEKLQLKAYEKYKAKDYDAALKLLAKIERLDPKYKDAYYLEAGTWKELENTVKEPRALEKILPLLDFSSPSGKDFAAEILFHIATTYSILGNGINLSNTVIKAHRINITAISLKESITS